ncbi:MAG: glycoside hydrolase family 2 TIM barrel-domain containing protein [Synoicihabitans sp.]
MDHSDTGTVTSNDASPAALTPEPSKVAIIRNSEQGWQLTRNDQPYTIRGAGGFEHLAQLRAHGGNTIRTWGAEQLEVKVEGETLLDKAARLGLTAMVGIWLEHSRRGVSYGDQEFLTAQRNRVRETVRYYRDHPALLIWGLGNEVEEEGNDPRVWQELEHLAQIVKAEDPDHPVCTVIAGTSGNKVANMMEHYSSLDLLGVNIYNGAKTVEQELAQQGWEKPYLLTEFGPVGHWETDATKWGAPLEPSSVEKADTYAASHKIQFLREHSDCLGSFCFMWGQKQETTATWFGMFLPTGEKTPAVDAMSRIWTGKEPENRAPLLYKLHSELKETEAAPGTRWKVTADALDPDGDRIEYEWQVVEETSDRRSWGDFELTPPEVAGCIEENHGREAVITVPHRAGAYRVFLFVRDGRGGGAAGNFPFLVK